MHFTNTTFSLLMSGTESKQHQVALFFLLCHHFQFWVVGKLQVAQIKKGIHDRFPRSFLFLSMPFPSFCMIEVPAQTENAALDSQCPYWVVGQPRHRLGLRLRPHRCVLWGPVLMGHEGIRSQSELWEGQTHILSTSPPTLRDPLSHRTSLKNTSSKTRIKKFKVAVAEHGNQAEPFIWGPVGLQPCPSLSVILSFQENHMHISLSSRGVYLFIINMDSLRQCKECSKILWMVF